MCFLVRRKLDALDLFQFFPAALHLLRFGGLVAKAVDKRFEALQCVRAGSCTAASSWARFSAFCDFVLRVAARVEVDSLVPDFRDFP